MPKERLGVGSEDGGKYENRLLIEELGDKPEKRGDEPKGRNVFRGEEAELMQRARLVGDVFLPGRYTPAQWVVDESGNRILKPAVWDARPRGLNQRTPEEQVRLYQEALRSKWAEQDLGWGREIPDEPLVPRRVYGGDDRHPYSVKGDPRNPR